jgi:hypothetical protein
MDIKTRLYVYTGTGNSLWVARQLALELKKAAIEFMPYPKKPFKVRAGAVGIIFPVHIWGLPDRVIQFVSHLKVKPGAYLFAVAVNAGQPAATLLQLSTLDSVGDLNWGRLVALGQEHRYGFLVLHIRYVIGRIAISNPCVRKGQSGVHAPVKLIGHFLD